ncbi:G-box-binding factor 1-like [Bidens hawaiensis]|uniref:G-box-binding factor 1-like n=1 Tax=Bidens hawaiensis TaxID=980011 RepID=UPI004049A7F7
MGAGEGGKSTAKPSKPTLTQEANPPSYADWQTSMQAYYGGAAPPPFFPSIVASPTPHPYMWGGQHPMMPPYGAPVPYPTLYSPPEAFAHPGTNIGTCPKVASSSANEGPTAQSAESENDGSSDANLQNEYPVGNMPATDRNAAPDMQCNPTGAPQTVVPPPIMGVGPWARQDERELKRQKRKQSNRESARRSRMRKQAECEELQARVDVLNNENQGLKDELQKLSEECKKLKSENESIKDKLSKFREPEAMSEVDVHSKSRADEGQS